jgi:hypothetical protein
VDQIPPLSVHLIEALAKAYPARCIAPGQHPEDAHRYAGKVELVQGLLTIMSRDAAIKEG